MKKETKKTFTKLEKSLYSFSLTIYETALAFDRLEMAAKRAALTIAVCMHTSISKPTYLNYHVDEIEDTRYVN